MPFPRIIFVILIVCMCVYLYYSLYLFSCILVLYYVVLLVCFRVLPICIFKLSSIISQATPKVKILEGIPTALIMQGNFNVMTLNVRALRNPVKRRSIFGFLEDQNCEAYFLQETYSELSDEIIWRSEWGGVVFFSHGSTHSKGVCILMNPSLNCDFDNLQKVQNGRIVSVDLSLNGSKFSLCNIYVPNDQRKQQEFLQDLSAYLMSNTDIERLIVGGDWNITLQLIDKRGGTSWKPTAARDKLLTLMNEFALVDIFRERNQHKTSYTYESKALKLSSRIDFFLIAQHLTKWVERVETKVANAPDHRAVKFTISIAQVPRGPGLWKFNNSLLEDGKYVDLIRKTILSSAKSIQKSRTKD